MIEIKPPRVYDPVRIFLAGSIEMGKAVEWQKEVVYALEGLDVIVYNPRRNDWDSTWTDESPELRAQIHWELHHLKKSEIIFFYFDPNTKSPVTMMEFGKYIDSRFSDPSKKIIVVCPPGFWRRINILETAKFYGHDKVYDSLDEGIDELKRYVKQWYSSTTILA